MKVNFTERYIIVEEGDTVDQMLELISFVKDYKEFKIKTKNVSIEPQASHVAFIQAAENYNGGNS